MTRLETALFAMTIGAALASRWYRVAPGRDFVGDAAPTRFFLLGYVVGSRLMERRAQWGKA